MALQRLLKAFKFENKYRSRYTFSDADKIRLNPTTQQLELKVQSYDPVSGDPVYPLDTDLTVTTNVTNPDTLQQWLSFGANPTDLRDDSQPDGCSVRYKLNDGTDDRYWDGADWSVAGATDWNTEEEVAENIGTFPASSQQLGLVVNLVTTDENATPTLQSVDVLMECQIDYIKSIIADALVPSLRAGITTVVNVAVVSAGGTKVSLNDLQTAYNIVGVDAVYDHTTDEKHHTDLLSSYDTDGKIITLASSIPRGNDIWVRLEAEPEVYIIWSGQDYLEVEKVPAVVVDVVDISGNEIWARQEVRNAATKQASVRRFPFRLHFDFAIRLLAESNGTLLPMMDRALEHAAQTPLLPWPAVDEQISMQIATKGLFRGSPSLSDVHESSYSLVLNDVHLWLRSEETQYLVQRANLNFSTPGLQGGSKWTGRKPGHPRR